MAYSTMFSIMFDLITVDYIMDTTNSNTLKIIHPSREPPKRGEILPMFVQKYCSYMPQLISKSETVKYLHKVGENLIFLFSPVYFIVGFGRHIELSNLHNFSQLVPYFWLTALILDFLHLKGFKTSISISILDM